MRELYAAAGFDPPRQLDSPFDACWANALLTAPYSITWTRIVKGLGTIKAYREDLDRVRSILCKSTGESNFEAVLAAVGPPIGSPFALAVAYETMRRVDAKVRIVTTRLREMGYAFKTEAMRTENWARGAESAMNFASKLVQPSSAAPQVQSIFTSVNEMVEGVCLTIAPDDLRKADTSGGAPYELELPNPGADTELLNERHRLPFVDYLRLCFRFGGFPGYEAIDCVPAEIKTLCEDLLAF